MSISEKQVEKRFNDRVKAHGGITRKWSSPANRGVPDRLAFFPNGEAWAVEIKKPDGELSPLQRRELRILGEMKFNTAVIYGYNDIDVWLEETVKYRGGIRAK